MFHFLAQLSTNAVSGGATPGGVEKGLSLIEWLTKVGWPFVLSHVLPACLLCLGGAYLIRVLTFSTRKALQKSDRVNPLLQTFICSAVHKVGWVILLILVLQRLEILPSITPIIAGLGLTSVVIGFACQDSLANLAAGMMIALNHPFKVGDFVSTGGIEGFVSEQNMVATILLTGDNKKITVPNKVVWASPITNYTAMDCRRVEIALNIPYGADIPKVRQVVLETLQRNPMILSDPPPMVEIMAFGNASLCLVIRPWCRPPDYWLVLFHTTAAINEAFAKNGIRIALPEQIVHLRQDAAPAPVRDGDRT